MSDAMLVLGAEQLHEIDTTLASVSDSSDKPLRLCFDNHWAQDTSRPALLAAALMGSLRSRTLVINAVDDDAVAGLLRFGVATALARRVPGSTSFTGCAAALEQVAGLGTLWTTGSRATTAALFGEDSDGVTGAVGPRHATFVNPQLSSGPDGHADIVFLVRRWLTRRLSSDPNAPTLESVEAVATVLYELIANVQEHAIGTASPHPECLARIAFDDGAIRCSVLDTGIGLDCSLRAKVLRDKDPASRVTDLIEGRIPGWDAGRGAGLPRVQREVAARGGHLSLATERLRVRSDPSVGVSATTVEFSLQGSVVDVLIPL